MDLTSLQNLREDRALLPRVNPMKDQVDRLAQGLYMGTRALNQRERHRVRPLPLIDLENKVANGARNALAIVAVLDLATRATNHDKQALASATVAVTGVIHHVPISAGNDEAFDALSVETSDLAKADVSRQSRQTGVDLARNGWTRSRP